MSSSVNPLRLKRWTALSRYLDDGIVPIDNNWCEKQIRPWALGRKNWIFYGLTAQRQTGSGDHEFDPVGASQRA